MATKARGELLSITDRVVLTATFYDDLGEPVDTDFYPTVSIVQPSGGVSIGPTSSGVQQIGTGTYSYSYDIAYGSSLGIFNDIWQGTVNGLVQTQTLSFVVFDSNLPAVISPDGYVALGEDPGFHYSQLEIMNINKLIKTLRERLRSSGKVARVDSDGNTYYQDCDIFSVETLVSFLCASLSMFNQIPHITFFQWSHTNIVDLFHEVLVEGAVIYALGSQSLIEAGRAWNLSDNGISVQVPMVHDLMNSQYSQLLTMHQDKVKYIKASLKPGPASLGSLSMTNGTNPIARRLSTLRARRLF